VRFHENTFLFANTKPIFSSQNYDSGPIPLITPDHNLSFPFPSLKSPSLPTQINPSDTQSPHPPTTLRTYGRRPKPTDPTINQSLPLLTLIHHPLLYHWTRTYLNHQHPPLTQTPPYHTHLPRLVDPPVMLAPQPNSATMSTPMFTLPNHPPHYPVPPKAPAIHWHHMFPTTDINLYIAPLLVQSTVSQNLVLIQKLLPIPNGKQLCSMNYRHFSIITPGPSLYYQRAKL
jgi:hypothetical protein